MKDYYEEIKTFTEDYDAFIKIVDNIFITKIDIKKKRNEYDAIIKLIDTKVYNISEYILDFNSEEQKHILELKETIEKVTKIEKKPTKGEQPQEIKNLIEINNYIETKLVLLKTDYNKILTTLLKYDLDENFKFYLYSYLESMHSKFDTD